MRVRSSLAAVAAALATALATAVVPLAVSAPAQACGGLGSPCGGGSGGGGGGDDGTSSSGTVTHSYVGGAGACTVYANGTGMGSWCAHGVGSADGPETLRERFPGQVLQPCRYDEIPPGFPQPENLNPDKGHYMLLTCITHVLLDTPFGGPKRQITMNLVFVPNGADTADPHNGITDFVWDNSISRTSLPVPFLQTKPTRVPLVGVPTYLTFQWRDPKTGNIVAQGPYADSPNGGPYIETDNGGLRMTARATRIQLNPHQQGMDELPCPDVTTPYDPRAALTDQPAGACKIVFPRSSASAQQLSDIEIPPEYPDSFYTFVVVEWEIRFGDANGMQQLGEKFIMRVPQPIPVREVQVPNQPQLLFDYN